MRGSRIIVCWLGQNNSYFIKSIPPGWVHINLVDKVTHSTWVHEVHGAMAMCIISLCYYANVNCEGQTNDAMFACVAQD